MQPLLSGRFRPLRLTGEAETEVGSCRRFHFSSICIDLSRNRLSKFRFEPETACSLALWRTACPISTRLGAARSLLLRAARPRSSLQSRRHTKPDRPARDRAGRSLRNNRRAAVALRQADRKGARERAGRSEGEGEGESGRDRGRVGERQRKTMNEGEILSPRDSERQ